MFWRSTYPGVEPYLKVYSGANPLAYTSAITYLKHTKSPNWLLIREKFNFSQKTSRNLRKGPSDPGSPGTSVSYYFLAKYGTYAVHTALQSLFLHHANLANDALQVPPAVPWLMIYRRLQVRNTRA